MTEQTSASKREPGYYWVKPSAADTWEVGEYFGEGVWRVYGDDLPERYLKEIDERRIERPSPQQQPDTNEDTMEQATIDMFRSILIRHGVPHDRCAREIALLFIEEEKYRQPDELSKARPALPSEKEAIAEAKRVKEELLQSIGTELVKAQQRVKELEEGITKVLPELVYQSAADPEKWFMWGRSGGDKIPNPILNLMQSVNYKEQP